VLLQDQRLASVVKGSVETCVPLESSRDCLENESEQRQFETRRFVLPVYLDTPGFKVRDVRLIVMSDVRNHRPVTREIEGRSLLNATERALFHRTKSGKIHFRP